MKRKYTDGSIIPIIVIVATLGLISALGYIFWSNSQQSANTAQDSETIQMQDTPSDTTSLQEGMISDIFPAKISWKYPETWSSTTEGPLESGGVTTQTVTLTSPSGAYGVVYRAGMNGGLGGACIPGESTGTLQHVSTQDTNNFHDAVFAEFIYDTYSISNLKKTFEGYDYTAGLFKNNPSLQSVSIGDSYCKIYLKNVFVLENDKGTTMLSADIKINAASTNIPSDTTAPISTAFNQPEYQDAVKILLSTSVEK